MNDDLGVGFVYNVDFFSSDHEKKESFILKNKITDEGLNFILTRVFDRNQKLLYSQEVEKDTEFCYKLGVMTTPNTSYKGENGYNFIKGQGDYNGNASYLRRVIGGDMVKKEYDQRRANLKQNNGKTYLVDGKYSKKVTHSILQANSDTTGAYSNQTSVAYIYDPDKYNTSYKFYLIGLFIMAQNKKIEGTTSNNRDYIGSTYTYDYDAENNYFDAEQYIISYTKFPQPIIMSSGDYFSTYIKFQGFSL